MTRSGRCVPGPYPSFNARLGAALAFALAWTAGHDVAVAASANAAPAPGPQTRAKPEHQAKPSAIVKANPSSRAPRAIKRVGLEDGWTLPICYVPVDRRRPVQCTNVGTISRQSPEIALRLAEAVNRLAETRRGSRRGRLSAKDILADLVAEPELLGCAGSGRQQGASYLASRHMAAMRPVGGGRGLDKRTASACSDASNGGSDGIAIGTAVADWQAAVESEQAFYTDWLRDDRQCENGSGGGGGHQSGNTMMEGDPDSGNTAGGGGGARGSSGAGGGSGTPNVKVREQTPPSIVRVIATKIWATVSPNNYRPETKNAADAVRGYCFADADCATPCHGNAMARSLASELARSGYGGCNANVTPAPGTTDTCYNVLHENQLTESMRRQLWKEACEARGGAQQACDDPSVCSVRCVTPDELATSERSWKACGNPQAMCGPDQVGGWPGAEPPKPSPGPVPFP
jgi:hypothetical protein